MERDVARDRIVGYEAGRDHEAQLVLFEHVAAAVFDPGFGTSVGDLFESKGRHIVVRGLLRVADVELDVVPIDACERITASFRARVHDPGLGEASGGALSNNLRVTTIASTGAMRAALEHLI